MYVKLMNTTIGIRFGLSTLLPAIKVILIAVPVTKVKCILRSKVLLLLLVLLVKARSGSK